MAKILNLDDWAKSEEMVLTLGGESHTMKDMSVGDFINNAVELEAMEKNSKDLSGQVQTLVNMIGRVFPSIKKDTLLALSMPQLNHIMTWVQTRGNDQVAEDKEQGKASPAAS